MEDLPARGLQLAAETVAEIVGDLAGPSAKVVGEILADPLRVFQWKRQRKLIERVTQYAREKDIPLRALRAPVLLPLLEHAAVEDDESMQARWAGLLLNSAQADRPRETPPSFPSVLRELSPDEARMLDRLSENPEAFLSDQADILHSGLTYREIRRLFANDWPETEFDRSKMDPNRLESLKLELDIALDNLVRLELVRRIDGVELNYQPITRSFGNDLGLPEIERYTKYSISFFGQEFIRACRVPGDMR